MSMSKTARKRVSVIEVNKEHIIDQTRLDVCDDDISTGPRFGCRHVQAVLLCLALVFGISTRTNLSVAIVAMTENTSPNPNVPSYNWNNTSVILSAFFWSYVPLQVLAGYLGKTYGVKYFLLVALFINFCTCAAIPLAAAKLGSVGVISCRILQGICQGFLYPSVHVMQGSWVPERERTTMNNFIFAGVGLGSIYASLLTGYISASWWGWTYSFYFLSIFGFIWCILWFLFAHTSPSVHPSISKEEKNYIQRSLKQEDDDDFPTPWKKMFRCIPFYALMVAYVGNLWGYAIFVTETPTYLAKVMNFDVKSNAIINSIPTVFGFIPSLLTGPLSDWVTGNNYLSTFNARRIFHLIGSYGQALCLLWLSLLTKNQAYLSVVILTISNLLTSFVLVGSNVNHLDLSPRFGGVMFGILNAIGQLASIISPLVVQWTVTDTTNIAQWRIIFLIAAGFFIFGSTIFSLFGSATRQSWDGPEAKNTDDRKKKLSVVSLKGI